MLMNDLNGNKETKQSGALPRQLLPTDDYAINYYVVKHACYNVKMPRYWKEVDNDIDPLLYYVFNWTCDVCMKHCML